MKQPHIAIFTIPSPVHVNPTLPIVCTMLRRGYRVSYVTSSRYSSDIKVIGAEAILCPRFEAPFGQACLNSDLPIEEQRAKDLLDLAARTLSAVSSFYEVNRPDLVVYDTHSFSGLILAERLNVRGVRITSHLIRDELELFGKTLTLPPFFRTHGVDRRDAIFTSAQATVYLYLHDLQAGRHESDHAPLLYAARCAAERSCREHWKSRFDDDCETVLVSGSTAYIPGPEHYTMCMNALSRLGRRGILAIGGSVDPRSLDPLPPNFEVVQHIPQIALMPRVELLIAQGGMATTMEALYHGLPQLLLTYGYPQLEIYADNIHRHEIGMHLRKPDMSVDNIVRCITDISRNFILQSKVKELQQQIKRSPGAEEVVNFLEDFFGRR